MAHKNQALLDAKRAHQTGKYILLPECRCQLNPNKLPANIPAHKWLEEGDSADQVVAKAAVLGYKLGRTAVSRHRRLHLRRWVEGDNENPDAGVELSELDTINRVIQQFGRQVAAGKVQISTEQGLKAIELKLKLTQGSVWDAMFDAMKRSQEDDSAEDLDQIELPEDPSIASAGS